MKKLLITGAYGLVGSNICKVLGRDYPEIDITKTKCDEPMPFFDKKGACINFDYIIFAAGYGQPKMFSADKIKTIDINTRFVSELFEYHLKEDGKFLYISTSEVYSGAPSPHKETDIGTTTPQHPRACYIEGKRCGEAICMAYKEQGYDVKIARLALAYGPGTKKHDTRVINEFIEQALTTGRIQMKDHGEALRTYLYVEDCAKIMLDILFKGKDVVYNVGGISEVTIEELANLISMHTKAKVFKGDKPLVGSPDSVKLDITKIREEFDPDFEPIYDGLKKTIEYQKKLYGIK
jgi:UDP-glucuronate decarboxylase